MRHALAVLTGIAVGLPVMAALASMSGHTAGGLPDRYVPWAHTGQHVRTGFATLRTPGQRRTRPSARRTLQRARRVPASTPHPTLLVTTPPGTLSRIARPGTHPRAAPRHRARTGAGGQPAPTADLRVSIAAPHTVKSGGSYTYRIRLANRGPSTPSVITVRNLLPKGVTRTGSTLPDGVGGYAGSRDATLVMPRLAPGRSATVRFNVRVRPKVRGDLVARSRIAYAGGVRVRRPGEGSSKVSTRIR